MFGDDSGSLTGSLTQPYEVSKKSQSSPTFNQQPTLVSHRGAAGSDGDGSGLAQGEEKSNTEVEEKDDDGEANDENKDFYSDEELAVEGRLPDSAADRRVVKQAKKLAAKAMKEAKREKRKTKVKKHIKKALKGNQKKV